MENPVTDHIYAVVLKDTEAHIGGCQLKISDGEASVGWLLHRDHWKKGYGTEIGEELLRFGFEEKNIHRITAECDAENHGSYRVMEKIGMRREGLMIASRPANKLSNRPFSDALLYAILKEEWEAQREIAHYNALPCAFDEFMDVPALSDGVIYLVCTAKQQAIPEKQYVPAYIFAVCLGGEKIGEISLRIGYSDRLYYGGHIGYDIDEKHRGNGYAGRACRLLETVAKAHGMRALLITNVHDNEASKRVCDKLGTRLVRVARLPEWSELYEEGYRFVNVFEWDI
jgi:RimJ/RimL family protein N-acetyltransferase